MAFELTQGVPRITSFQILLLARGFFDRAFHAAKSIPELESRYRLGSLSFEDDERLTPLQAADFLAYEICKAYTDIASGVPRFRKSLRAVFRKINRDWKVGSEDNLLDLAKQANILPK